MEQHDGVGGPINGTRPPIHHPHRRMYSPSNNSNSPMSSNSRSGRAHHRYHANAHAAQPFKKKYSKSNNSNGFKNGSQKNDLNTNNDYRNSPAKSFSEYSYNKSNSNYSSPAKGGHNSQSSKSSQSYYNKSSSARKQHSHHHGNHKHQKGKKFYKHNKSFPQKPAQQAPQPYPQMHLQVYDDEAPDDDYLNEMHLNNKNNDMEPNNDTTDPNRVEDKDLEKKPPLEVVDQDEHEEKKQEPEPTPEKEDEQEETPEPYLEPSVEKVDSQEPPKPVFNDVAMYGDEPMTYEESSPERGFEDEDSDYENTGNYNSSAHTDNSYTNGSKDPAYDAEDHVASPPPNLTPTPPPPQEYVQHSPIPENIPESNDKHKLKPMSPISPSIRLSTPKTDYDGTTAKIEKIETKAQCITTTSLSVDIKPFVSDDSKQDSKSDNKIKEEQQTYFKDEIDNKSMPSTPVRDEPNSPEIYPMSPVTKAPKVSTKSKRQKNKVERHYQLFNELPSKTEEATRNFEIIQESIYTKKNLGSSGQDEVMACDCRKIWDGNQNLACSEDSDCINRLTSIECVNSKCFCGSNCQNQRFQKHEYASVDVIQTEKKGYGLRALQNILPGRFVIEYVGEVISEFKFRKRAEEYKQKGNKHFYFMMLQKGEFIDATVKGGLARFCNHSCDPNCYVDKWIVGDKLRMGIFTKREILCGEEITFDYNVDRYGAEAQECYCGEPNCIGILGGKTQTESVNKLSQVVLDALDMDDIDEDAWLENHFKRKKGKRKSYEDDEDDDDYSSSLPTKPISLNSVSKIMSSLMQSREEWLITKLVSRILATDDKQIHIRVMQMHGYQTFNNILKDWRNTSPAIIRDILDIMTKWPRLTKNKISSSKIEITVKDIAENFEYPEPDENADPEEECDIKATAKNLLKEWGNLQMAYRIPRRERAAVEEENTDSNVDAKESSPEKEEADRTAANTVDLSDLKLPEGPRKIVEQQLQQKLYTIQLKQRLYQQQIQKAQEKKVYDHRGPEFSSSNSNFQETNVMNSIPFNVSNDPDILPPGWKSAEAPDGQIYYYNRELQLTQWERPVDPMFERNNYNSPNSPQGPVVQLESNGGFNAPNEEMHLDIKDGIAAQHPETSSGQQVRIAMAQPGNSQEDPNIVQIDTPANKDVVEKVVQELTLQKIIAEAMETRQREEAQKEMQKQQNALRRNNNNGLDTLNQLDFTDPVSLNDDSVPSPDLRRNSHFRNVAGNSSSISPSPGPLSLDHYPESFVKPLQKAFAKIVPNIVVRYESQLGHHDKVKQFSREIVHLFIEKLSHQFEVDQSSSLAHVNSALSMILDYGFGSSEANEETKSKVKSFAREYMNKVIIKIKSRQKYADEEVLKHKEVHFAEDLVQVHPLPPSDSDGTNIYKDSQDTLFQTFPTPPPPQAYNDTENLLASEPSSNSPHPQGSSSGSIERKRKRKNKHKQKFNNRSNKPIDNVMPSIPMYGDEIYDDDMPDGEIDKTEDTKKEGLGSFGNSDNSNGYESDINSEQYSSSDSEEDFSEGYEEFDNSNNNQYQTNEGSNRKFTTTAKPNNSNIPSQPRTHNRSGRGDHHHMSNFNRHRRFQYNNKNNNNEENFNDNNNNNTNNETWSHRKKSRRDKKKHKRHYNSTNNSNGSNSFRRSKGGSSNRFHKKRD